MTDSDAAGDRPGDQAAVCPSWCVGDHDPGEGDEDRLHCSRSILVPGIILMSRHQREGDQQSRDVTTFDADSPGLTDGRIELPGGDAAVGVTLTVAAHRKGDSPPTWVYIGDGGRGGLDISSETAWLLVGGLGVLLGEVVEIGKPRGPGPLSPESF